MSRSGLMALLLVALGGAAGSAGRAAIGLAWPDSPLAATLLVNVLGAFLLGALVAVLDGPRGAGDIAGVTAEDTVGAQRLRRQLRARLLLGTGFCGGFTTYSTVAVQTAELARDSEVAVAAGYALATLIVGAVATLLGLAAAGWMRGAQ